MCKKEKYEKHRNVLVSFFAFAMLVIPNFQKLSLGTRSILSRGFFRPASQYIGMGRTADRQLPSTGIQANASLAAVQAAVYCHARPWRGGIILCQRNVPCSYQWPMR